MKMTSNEMEQSRFTQQLSERKSYIRLDIYRTDIYSGFGKPELGLKPTATYIPASYFVRHLAIIQPYQNANGRARKNITAINIDPDKQNDVYRKILFVKGSAEEVAYLIARAISAERICREVRRQVKKKNPVI